LADKAKTLVDNLFVVLRSFLCPRIVAWQPSNLIFNHQKTAKMTNELIEKRLEHTEKLLLGQKDVFTFEECCLYTGISRTYRGIMLVGKYGSGKTVIMQAMTELHNTIVHTLQIPRPLLKFLKSSELLENLKENPIKNYARLPLVIDEFGREPKQIMDFGNLKSPIIELLCERYDNGSLTHGTSNFTLDTLCSENQYGKMTGDRIKSMFNFVELKGESRRT